MSAAPAKTGSDLFIVDNSDDDWKVLDDLAEAGGWQRRDEAARLLARWLGYASTGGMIECMVESLVRGVLREERIEAEDGMIRRVSGA